MGEVFHPAKLEAKIEKVLVKEAGSILEVRPAKYEWVDEQVLIREAYTRLEVVPAVFKKRVSRVMVIEPKCRVAPVEAVWTNKLLRVDVMPAHKTFIDGKGIVSVPAKTKMVPSLIISEPPGTRVVDPPVKYRSVTQEVMVTAARVREVKVPTEYGTVRIRKEVTPAMERTTVQPAVHKDVETQVLVAKSRNERVPILCQAERTPKRILALQEALKAAGHDPGKLDGRLHPQTEAALHAYQHAEGLGIGALSLETLKRLKVP